MSVFHKVIVKAWVEKDGRFLLAKRGASELHHAGVWSLPGGNIEETVDDEILEKTIKRELQEEIGIDVEDEMDITYNNGFIKESDGSHVVNITMLCHWKSGEPKPLEDTEEICWYTLEELELLENKPVFLEKEILFLKRHLNNL